MAGTPQDMHRRRSERSSPIPGSAFHPDPLSDVLAELRVEQSLLSIFDFGAPWGVQIDHMPLAISWTVVEGTVWILSRGIEPIAFHAGDTFLLPRGIVGAPYVFASSPDVKPKRTQDLYREAELQGFGPGSSPGRRHYVRWGGRGDQTRVVSTAFGFRDRGLSPLIAALPELMFVRASETGGEFIDVMLRLALDGEDHAQPGFAALVAQLSQSLAVLVVRTYALSADNGASGWLAGLGDFHISRALACIHREPDHLWTVATLARIAGLSRSLFAERFLARVGQTPKRYLRAWRMHLARDALAGGNIGVTALAHRLGYQSEAAFRTAFRHATGEPPREFRCRAEAGFPKVAEDVAQSLGILARLYGPGDAQGMSSSDLPGDHSPPS